MPDFTMCTNKYCPLRNFCKRHPNSGTKPSAKQSWSLFEPNDDQTCEYFWRK